MNLTPTPVRVVAVSLLWLTGTPAASQASSEAVFAATIIP
jgi:hypothetical protein